jgi:hypothetical protein
MRTVGCIWIFYQKLIFPSLVISFLVGAMGIVTAGPFSLESAGVAFMLITPLFQYFIYEIANPEEYYFYYNMGLSKPVLWICTVILSVGFGLIPVFV